VVCLRPLIAGQMVEGLEGGRCRQGAARRRLLV